MTTPARPGSTRFLPTALVVFVFLLGGRAAPFLPPVAAQTPVPTEFEIVSIKRVDELRQGGGLRILPDGTFMMTNQSLDMVIGMASPVPVSPRDVVGMPEWMRSERYDVTAKPPAGLTREQLGPVMQVMWAALFADRTRLVAHVEQREKDAFVMVLAREDGRLGPNLKASTLDCTPRPPGAPPASPQMGASLEERRTRCGVSMARGTLVSGSMTIAQLAKSVSGLAGGEVEDRTGLAGSYAIELTYAIRGSGNPAANAAAPFDDAPDFVTALQEQLGLKLRREKRMMPVFVIDHIERPTPN